MLEPQLGNQLADFTFVDNQDKSSNLSQNLGDFTILAFTKCGGEMHGHVSSKLAQLVKKNQDTDATTICYDIHWSENGCSMDEHCHLLDKGRYIFSICDARAGVRRIYGLMKTTRFFVIGPDRRIVDKDFLTNFAALKNRFRNIFREYADQKLKERDPDM